MSKKKDVDQTKKQISGKKIFSYGTNILLILLAIYFLMPPKETTPVVEGLEPTIEEVAPAEPISEDIKYVIKVAPSNFYMPGNRPFGVLPPVVGLKDTISDFEKLYPDTRIEAIRVPSGVREYLVTQLSSGVAPEIMTTNAENVWPDVHKDWYVPLDDFLNEPNPFVVAQGNSDTTGYEQWWDMFKNQAVSRGKACPSDGKNYSIVPDMVETGIFYNKTMFEKYGIGVPETWAEMISSMKILKNDGIIPLLTTYNEFISWSWDLVFDQLYYDILPGIDLYKDPVREVFLQGYLDPDEIIFLNKKGFFTEDDPRFIEMWRILYELTQYMSPDFNSTTRSDTEIGKFFNQEGAMLWVGSWVAGDLVTYKNMDFEWDIFYLPPITKETSIYANGHDMCVIGGSGTTMSVTNSAISDTDPSLPFEERIATSKKLRRTIEFLQFMTLPKNNDRIVNEFPSFLPNVVGVTPMPELESFEEMLDRRYATTKWASSFDVLFVDTFKRMYAMLLADGNLDNFVDWQMKSIKTAGADYIDRYNPDMTELQIEWDRLAPVRANMIGLPQGALEGGNNNDK